MQISSSSVAGLASTVGGLTSNCDNCKMISCSVSGSISQVNQFVGGLSGRMVKVVIVKSISNMNISATGDYIGGLVGAHENTTNFGSTGFGPRAGSEDTYFWNIIYASKSNGTIFGRNRVGGISGYSRFSTLENTEFTGQVSGVNYVGGVSGFSSTFNQIYSPIVTGQVIGTGAPVNNITNRVQPRRFTDFTN